MSPEATVVLHPEVLAFVAAVRIHLADLDPDEQREILDGLEADLNELIDEQGVGALGDPAAYAAELRQAAGLDDRTDTRRRSRSVTAALTGVLDASNERARAQLDRLPDDAAQLLTWLRPVWWIARAWVATELLDGLTGWGLLPLVVAVPLSVQIGRRRIWPGRPAGLTARVVLLALNTFAVAMVPIAVAILGSGAGYDQRGYDAGYSDATAAATGADLDQEGTLFVGGTAVSNVYPYDAAGRPLVGVQLFDQQGKPLRVGGGTECVYDGPDEMVTNSVRTYFGWSDGAAQKKNVFPLPSRVQPDGSTESDATAFASSNRPTVSGFPFASVPRVSLPGLLTSTAVTPPKAFVPGARTGPVNMIEYGC